MEFSNSNGDLFRPGPESWVKHTSWGVVQATPQEVFNAMASKGHCESTPAQGYWTLDGVRIDNPAEELGNEFGDVCEYVETSPSSPVFVRDYTDEQIEAAMAQAEADSESALEAGQAALLAELAECTLAVTADTSLAFGRKVSAVWTNRNYRTVHCEVNLQRQSRIDELNSTAFGRKLLALIKAADGEGLLC